MAKSKKDSVIFYQEQIKICKKHLTVEQFGRLMSALFELGDGGEPEVDTDIALAYDFMSLQQKLDQEKYQRICERNKKNGALGGRPKNPNNPNNPNGFFKNPNDNDNDNDNENENDNENDSALRRSAFGSFHNVTLSADERASLTESYERSTELIDKVSVWLRNAKNPVPDHYALCLTFADNEEWPRRKVIEPVQLPEVTDPLDPDEQDRKVAEMRARLNGAIKTV